MNKKLDIWLPVILFVIIGLSIFLTEKRDGGSISGSLYGNTSAHGVTLSKNVVNGEHPLFMFSSRELKDDKITYDAYNRFPVFPFLITGLLISPFNDNLNLQIYLSRQVMNLFFFLSIIVAFKLVRELTNRKYLALSVAIISFSSYFILSNNDMIFNDIPALFGFLFAMYGVVKFQKSKATKYQLILYSIIPVSFGWQPYAVFGAWLLFEFIEIFFTKELSLLNKIKNFIRQPSFVITVLAICWGIIILSLQLLNEWRIVGGSFADLPSVSSGLWRSGIVSAKGHTTLVWTYDWLTYIPGQFRVITLMLIPFWPIFQVEPGINASVFLVIALFLFFILKYLKEKDVLNKTHLIFILSGFLWTIPMRNFVALHDFQSIFYIGFILSVFTILFSRINPKSLIILAANLTIVFFIAIAMANYYKSSYINPVTAQFQNIKNHLPTGSLVYFDGNRHKIAGYSKFAFDLFTSEQIFSSLNKAEFAISQNPEFPGERITNNSFYNLYKISEK